MSSSNTPTSPVQKPAKSGDAIPVSIARLLESQGIGSPLELIRTGTKIDTGRWFVSSPVWVAALPDRLVLVAEGPRNFLQQVPHVELGTSFYSEVSGELVCVPAPQLSEVRSLRMSLEQARQLLAIMRANQASIA